MKISGLSEWMRFPVNCAVHISFSVCLYYGKCFAQKFQSIDSKKIWICFPHPVDKKTVHRLHIVPLFHFFRSHNFMWIEQRQQKIDTHFFLDIGMRLVQHRNLRLVIFFTVFAPQKIVCVCFCRCFVGEEKWLKVFSFYNLKWFLSERTLIKLCGQ